MWCMGGSVRGVITGERMRDTDLFFASETDYKEFERRMLSRDDVECERHWRDGDREFISIKRKRDGHQYDPCNWLYGSIDDHIDQNEWLHTSAACDMRGNACIRYDVMLAIQQRMLIPSGSTLDLDLQLSRMVRFLNEGWIPGEGMYNTLVKKIHDSTTNDQWYPEREWRSDRTGSDLSVKRIS